MGTPLKGKKMEHFPKLEYSFFESDVKSALEWMIEQHEEKIEELAKSCETMFDDELFLSDYIQHIELHYESIMILEAGLEDVL